MRACGQHGTEVPTDRVGRFAKAFDTPLRAWMAESVAGQEPTGPSAWDGCAATVVTGTTVEALEPGRFVPTGLKPRSAFYGGAA
ncbi:hypothetical protein GCM10010260_36020 [Streptomyces filipinensis]|uniref:Uncharacterized protein n=1 Tax=Streptomyces filipinensis TaxID=66887 RepID=A0A918IB61_9ACTN|nr:hypothetical protein GCM10010260_36020 [Streptomyces filipinensis]